MKKKKKKETGVDELKVLVQHFRALSKVFRKNFSVISTGPSGTSGWLRFDEVFIVVYQDGARGNKTRI